MKTNVTNHGKSIRNKKSIKRGNVKADTYCSEREMMDRVKINSGGGKHQGRQEMRGIEVKGNWVTVGGITGMYLREKIRRAAKQIEWDTFCAF